MSESEGGSSPQGVPGSASLVSRLSTLRGQEPKPAATVGQVRDRFFAQQQARQTVDQNLQAGINPTLRQRSEAGILRPFTQVPAAPPRPEGRKQRIYDKSFAQADPSGLKARQERLSQRRV